MAQITGNRTTSQTINTELRNVRLVGPNIAYFDPDEAPLVTLLMALKRRSSVNQVKVEWIENDYVSRWGQMSATTAAGFSTANTTIHVVDGTVFVAGDLFVAPKAAASSANPEVIRVTAVSGNTLTVVRQVGGSGIDTIGTGTALRLIGSAFEENSLPPTAKSTAPTTLQSFTQIFKTTIDLSKTSAAANLYGGAERRRLQREAMVDHKRKMAAALLWSRPSEDFSGGPTGKPIRTTMGLVPRITSNVTDAGGTLTEKTLYNFSEQSFRYGAKQKILLASPKVVSAITFFGNSRLQIAQEQINVSKLMGDTMPDGKDLFLRYRRVIMPHGDWLLMRDWSLENPPAGSGTFSHMALSIDIQELRYFYLSNNGENRDTRLVENVINDGRDGYVDEILGECGFEVKLENRHAKLYNVTDYS